MRDGHDGPRHCWDEVKLCIKLHPHMPMYICIDTSILCICMCVCYTNVCIDMCMYILQYIYIYVYVCICMLLLKSMVEGVVVEFWSFKHEHLT